MTALTVSTPQGVRNELAGRLGVHRLGACVRYLHLEDLMTRALEEAKKPLACIGGLIAVGVGVYLGELGYYCAAIVLSVGGIFVGTVFGPGIDTSAY